MKQKPLFIILSLITIFSYSYFVYAAAPIGGYTPGQTLNPDCAPGDTDCIVALTTGGFSQWDDVVGGINYAGGNVGIGTTTPDARLKITGQNPNNYVSLLGGDSGTSFNNFGIHLQDNGPDQFGVIDMYASPEESFILSAYKIDGSASGSFRLSTQGITTISSSDDVGNSNNIEINPTTTSFNSASSVENLLFQIFPNVARFVPSTNTRSGVSIGNMGMISSDEAGLYDAGGDIPLAVFDATNNRAYYTPQMFVDYNAPVISMGDPFGSIGGVLVNYSDGSINIGRAETTAADGIEGIQVYQNGNNPTVRLGSSAYYGNGTNILINDANQTIGFNFSGGSYLFPNADGSAGQVLTTDGSGNLSWGGGGSSSPITIVNSTNLFSTGLTGTGQDVTVTDNSIFLGINAGNNATDASQSNFFGQEAGYNATYASAANFFGDSAGEEATFAIGSNFIGSSSGFQATTASFSNFIGNSAGAYATNANDSNFLGANAGAYATNASYSNFLGNSAGQNATAAYESNFFGINAGGNATNANDSNFLGQSAGANATNAAHSNFFGSSAGYNATYAYNSNFLGFNAGYQATDATNSNFLGNYAGDNASNAPYSNFLGNYAGYNASNAPYSNFLGNYAGYNATNASSSNFFGFQAGYQATNASSSNFFGFQAGYQATNAPNSNFLGNYAGDNASNAPYSNFLGNYAGYNATNASSSNFFGIGAGFSATNAYDSNFLGENAGYGATDAVQSNFIGRSAGYNATNAYNSNFLGVNAGSNATNAYYSNFFGNQAGQDATNASNSNFFGTSAGFSATNSSRSFFVGENAGAYNLSGSGLGTPNANNSIFIGNNAGYKSTDNALDNSTGGTSILIGDDTSTGGFSNSIALGKGATNTATNQFMIGSVGSPINETRFQGATIGTQCTITTGTGIACTSDERLKTNITDLSSTDILTKLANIRTVNYNLIGDTTNRYQVGFLAQNLEQYFPELVDTNIDGYKSVYYAQMTPILVEAIREMNLKITTINDMETPNTWRDSLIAWFGNTANGITELFAGRVRTHELCLDDVCVTKDQLQQLLQNSQQTIVPSSGGNPPTDPDPVVTPDDTTPSDSNPIENPNDSGDSNSDTPTADTPTE